MPPPPDPRHANRVARWLVLAAVGCVVLIAFDVAPLLFASLAFAASIGAYLLARQAAQAGRRAAEADREPDDAEDR